MDINLYANKINMFKEYYRCFFKSFIITIVTIMFLSVLAINSNITNRAKFIIGTLSSIKIESITYSLLLLLFLLLTYLLVKPLSELIKSKNNVLTLTGMFANEVLSILPMCLIGIIISAVFIYALNANFLATIFISFLAFMIIFFIRALISHLTGR